MKSMIFIDVILGHVLQRGHPALQRGEEEISS